MFESPPHTCRFSKPFFFPLFFLVLLLSACGQDNASFSENRQSPGVTHDAIILGSSLALTGHASSLGTQTLRGARSYLNKVNEDGGIFGRKIRIIAYDDAYDPPQCLLNTQRLIVEDQVFALFCYVGTPTTVKILPFLAEAKIPLLGIFTGANALRQPFNRYVINVRASYYEEIESAVHHLINDLKIQKIGVFYQYDAYGFDGLTGTELALQEYGLKPVARSYYIRGTTNVEEALFRMEDAGAEAVVMIGTYNPCAKFIQKAVARHYHPIFYTVSFVSAGELAKRLRNVRDSVILMSQVVPPPEQPLDTGSASEYVALLNKYFPDDKPTFVGLEGFINAQVLVKGLRAAGRDLTRERFIRGIESIRNLQLWPGVSVSFGPDDHQGLEQVYFTWLQAGHFGLLTNWDQVARAWNQEEPRANQEARP